MTADVADISVIVPAYRSAETIGRTLASIAAQTVKPACVIVVDDGSPDGTAEAARAMAGRMNGIDLIVLEQENAGAGAARNRALRSASMEFVAFLDADDAWLPEKIERSMDVLSQTASDLVSHDYVMIKGETESYINCARHFRGQADPFASLFLRGFIATSTIVVRREPIVAAGGFDETLPSGQDFDLWLALTAGRKVKFHVFGEALTRYHVIPGSITSRVASRRRCNLEILGRYGRVTGANVFSSLKTMALRAAIIQVQTMQAYAAQHKWTDALMTVFSTLPTLLSVPGSFRSKAPPRPDYLQEDA